MTLSRTARNRSLSLTQTVSFEVTKIGDGEPIPGLFAAGELVGGLFYFNYPGGTGLASGEVFGKLAGSSAGKYARP